MGFSRDSEAEVERNDWLHFLLLKNFYSMEILEFLDLAYLETKFLSHDFVGIDEVVCLVLQRFLH